MVLASGNIQDIEVLWTVIALLGVIFAIYNLKNSHKAVKFAQELAITNGRLVIARAMRVTEMIRFFIQSIFVTIGVLAMTLPPSTGEEIPINFRISAFAIRWGLVLAAILTFLQSFNSWRLHKYFLKDKRVGMGGKNE